MSNKHSIMIVGKDFSAFIDGIPDKCQHDWSGDEIFHTESGKTITPVTYLPWASYTSRIRNELIWRYHEEILFDPIVEGTVTCRKCNKEFYPDLNEF